MANNPEPPADDGLVQKVDDALRSYWAGAPEAFDRLVAEDDPESRVEVCSLLAEVAGHPVHEAPAPERIGDYVIRGLIGRGGMASVYEAVQETTGQIVALKVVRRLTQTDEGHLRFFHREVEMLARLKHPNIAALYDAGKTPDGFHYFAMERIEGEPLGSAHDEAGPPSSGALRERLGLFCKICRALSYAHQRGVIHCDLKPANIFVDTRGDPKILDFGLARVMSDESSLSITMTESSRIAGTLPYMSPEQASGDIDELDTRSDVYGLGVILYELLTGRRPYQVASRAIARAIKTISESPPKRPGEVDPRLRGDLETVMLKALEKEPDRRYQSAAALADDIERYLTDQPIVARAPTAGYQLRKLIARHKVPAALLAALLVLIVGSSILIAVQARDVRRQRDLAQKQATRAQQVNDYLQRVFSSLDPRDIGADIQMHQLIDRVASGMDAELRAEPETLAALHDVFGRSLMTLRQYDKAQSHLSTALELRRRHLGERDPLFAATLDKLGLIQYRLGDRAGGEEAIRKAHAIRLALLGEDHVDVADSLTTIAVILKAQGRYDEAEIRLREALEIQKRALGSHEDVALGLDHYAAILTEGGRFEEAEPILLEALDMRRILLGPDHYDLGRTLTDLGEIYWHRAEFKKAAAMHRERVRIYSKVLGADSDFALNGKGDLAAVLKDMGDFPAAEKHYRESLAATLSGDMDIESAIADTNDELTYRIHLYAIFLREQGRYREAEAFCRAAYNDWGRRPNVDDRPHPARAYVASNYAWYLFETGELDRAQALHRDAIAIWTRLFGDRNTVLSRSLIGLGELHEFRRAFAEAEALYQQSFDMCRRRLGDDNPKTAISSIHLAAALDAQGNPDAADMCRQALAALESKLGLRHHHVAWALSKWARILRRHGEIDEAQRRYHKAIEIERSLPREMHPHLADCLTGLGEMLVAQDDPASAEPLLREALDIQTTRRPSGDARIALVQCTLGDCLARLGRQGEAAAHLRESAAALERVFGRDDPRTQSAAARLRKVDPAS